MRPAAALLGLALLLAPGGAGAAGLLVGREGAAPSPVAAEALRALPARLVEAEDHGTRHRFEGPLLWQVLEAGGLSIGIREQARSVLQLTGADGYTALLAVGEIAPEFAARPAILALSRDGETLPEGAWRVVLPEERRGARGVRALARITLFAPRPQGE